ncbi:hypothetical protein V6U77_11305 [Micromonospora sp. CPCC 205546]|uniref:hypothetical protein n=1 Tax=Micromonospora sp. CPCC 205546 TaxID=3122397 RepID=UPI002FF282E4
MPRVLMALVAAIACVIAAAPGGAATAAPAQQPVVSVAGFSSVLTLDGRPAPNASGATPMVFPPSGNHAFTPQAPSWSFGDGNGSGTEQINYGSSLSEQWSYQLSAYVRSIIVGNVTQNGDLYCGSSKVTNYGQHVVAPSYLFHGSRGSLTNTCSYRTIITFAFRHNQGGGGNGTLTAQWNWVITWV